MRKFALLVLMLFSVMLFAQKDRNESVHELWKAIPVPEEIFIQMKGRSYPDECTTRLSDLRYIKILYVDENKEEQEGELVCNRLIANDLIDIFQKLYEAKYSLGKVQLIDSYYETVAKNAYGGFSMNTKLGGRNRTLVDQASMEDNNTSCFNFRYVTGTRQVSKHGLGMAIDINPLYNPYHRLRDGHVEPKESEQYVKNRENRSDIPMKIDKNDLCYKLFMSHGFKWGGAWRSSKDYQHFEK